MLTRTFVLRSWRSLLTSLSLLAAVSMLTIPTLHAQNTSSLHGVISDAQSAVIPGAAVALSSASTGVSRQVVTDNTGAYEILQVMPGEYTLTVNKPGFAQAAQEHVVLQANTSE